MRGKGLICSDRVQQPAAALVGGQADRVSDVLCNHRLVSGFIAVEGDTVPLRRRTPKTFNFQPSNPVPKTYLITSFITFNRPIATRPLSTPLSAPSLHIDAFGRIKRPHIDVKHHLEHTDGHSVMVCLCRFRDRRLPDRPVLRSAPTSPDRRLSSSITTSSQIPPTRCAIKVRWDPRRSAPCIVDHFSPSTRYHVSTIRERCRNSNRSFQVWP